MMLAGRDGTPEQVRFGLATINLFRTLGARVVVGRDFEESDGQAEASREGEQSMLPNYAILSHEFWRRRYGMDRGILGQSLDGAPRRRDQVVGVLAPGFELLFAPADNVESSPDIWFANRIVYDNAQRNQYTMRPIGRLRPGVTVQRAQAAVESVSEQIRRNFVTYGASNFYARLEPMHQALVMHVRPTMLALMGSVIFLLLIACANVLNLLLVRASLRAREMAVRASPGSGTWPLLRMSLAEALVLSAAGAVLGLAFARMGLHWLIDMAPANLPRLDAVRIDPVVVAVTAAVALAVAVIFGVAPLWGTLRGNVIQILRGTGRTAGLSGSGTLRSAVVIVEVALCFGLLIGSGLMLRSFLELQRIDPGFDARGLLTFELLGNPRDSEERRAAHARQVDERLRGCQGAIVSAAATCHWVGLSTRFEGAPRRHSPMRPNFKLPIGKWCVRDSLRRYAHR
jgi:putative ABC transport system permease protein